MMNLELESMAIQMPVCGAASESRAFRGVLTWWMCRPTSLRRDPADIELY